MKRRELAEPCRFCGAKPGHKCVRMSTWPAEQFEPLGWSHWVEPEINITRKSEAT